MFGKKKKDDSSVELDTGTDAQTPPQTQSVTPQSMLTQSPITLTTQNQPLSQPTQGPVISQPITPSPQPSMRLASPEPTPRQLPLDASFPSEETSLSRILQSLLQDIPTNTGSPFSPMRMNAPDYVPPRATPPSSAMVIGGKDEEGEWEEQGKVSTSKPQQSTPSAPAIKPSSPPATLAPTGKVAITPPPPVPQVTVPPIQQKRDQPVEKPQDKATKVEKPDKPDKPTKDASPQKPTKPPQSFDHIFELTQGNLESPGFVIINGSPGAGKTTFCSGLTANYLKRGDPCLYVTYDQAPSTLRERMKKLGSDPTAYESQYRFIIVDGYAS